MASFQELPDEILCNIFQYLNGKQLARCGMLCRRFFGLMEFDYEWKLRCERDWNISQLPRNFTTWKHCYVDMYGRFGPYLTCYKRVSKCWEKIFAVTQERCPAIYDSLRRDGIDEETLSRGWKLQSTLPLEYRCSYRLCNGQRSHWNIGGLFGSYYPDGHCDYLASYPRTNLRFGRPVDSPIRRCCLTFIFITKYGRIKRPVSLCVRDPVTSRARRNCQHDADHEHLNGLVVSFCPNSDELFIYGNSFIGFLENFADRITHYPVVNHRFLSYDFNAECDTGPFTVTVRTLFDRSIGRAFPVEYRAFHFYYRITMRMHPDGLRSDSCQLETHHWIITAADGEVDTLEGPGVAGEFPVMRPGADFSWSSHRSYSTPSGKMSGYFTMRKLNTGGEIRIGCPEFHLVAPPFVPI